MLKAYLSYVDRTICDTNIFVMLAGIILELRHCF